MAIRALWSKLTGGRGGRGNYPYVTARVRAKKTKLLPSSEYQKLLLMDADQIARFIQEGEYKREVEELGNKFAGAQLVEAATRLRLARTYREILSFSQGELRTLLELYLSRYDVYNVKTVLRGLRTNASDEDISRAIVPVGSLSVETLQELARLKDLESLVKTLSTTPFAPVLKKGMAAGGLERLAELENELDKRYYELLLANIQGSDAPKRALLSYLRREIDVTNLRTIVRLKLDNVEEGDDFFVPGGKDVTPETARRLLRAGKDEVVQTLADTDLAPAAEGVRKTLETGDLETTMDALDRLLIESGKTFSNRYPLSILPIVDFILRLRYEADDLRVIAYGKQTNLKDEVIKELVSR